MCVCVCVCSVDSEGRLAPRKWTAEEDELLRVAVESNDGKNWKIIAECVPGRNHVQCLQRYDLQITRIPLVVYR